MPYDIASALQYAQPGTAFNTGALSAANTKLTEANAIIAGKEGKYYEENLDLKKQQVENQKAATQVNAGELALKYSQWYKKLADGGLSEDQQRALKFNEDVQDKGLDIFNAMKEHGVPEDQAKAAVNSMFSGIIPGVKGAFDPNLATAMRLSAKDNTTEPQLRQVTEPGKKPYTANVVTDKRSSQAFIVDENGTKKPVNSAWLSAAPTEARTGPIKQEEVQVRNLQTATTNLNSTVLDTIKLLKQNPDINTYAARGVQLIGDVQAEASAVANQLGIPFDPKVLDIGKYQGTFNDLKIKSAQMQSVIVSLAYKAAAAEDQKGNGVSDKDINRFIKEIGAHNANPEAFMQTLVDVARRKDREFKTAYKIHTGAEFTGSTGIEEIEKLVAAPSPTAGGDYEEKTTPGGTKYRVKK